MAKDNEPDSPTPGQSNVIQLFEFRGAKVRTAGTFDSPLFCGMDVCAVLGLATKGKDAALARIPSGERHLLKTGSREKSGKTPNLNSGPHSLVYVTEPGLYRLIFSSDKPEAEAFQTWVVTEVLPAIRKQGFYSLIAEDRKEQTERLLADIFPNLPAKAQPMFRELIAAMLTLRREKPTGTPVWARPLARLIYHWAIQVEGQQPHRRGQNRERTSSTPDYSMLSEAGKERLRTVCAVGAAMTNHSVTWRDWKHKMQLNYENRPLQLELMVPMVFSRGDVHLPAKGKPRAKGPALLLAKNEA